MKCDLTLKDRMYILQALPGSGDYASVSLQKGLADRIDLNDEENKNIRQTHTLGGIAVDPKVDKETKEFEFSDKEVAMLKKEFENMEKVHQLNVGNINLYELFVGKPKK